MELWIPITIAAAFLQNLRSMLQKHLKAQLSSLGATAVRFFFAVPVALILWFILTTGFAVEPPKFTPIFFMFVTLGALAQIGGTLLLVYLFGLKNFAVGSTLARTEAVQSAVIGFVILGDRVSLPALMGLLVSLVGVVLISGRVSLLKGGLDRAAWIGIASGTGFSISAVSYRAASHALEGGGPLIHGAAVLLVTTALQSALLLGYFLVKDHQQLAAIKANWRVGALVGLTGGLASLGWFTALTMQNAAYIKALAQVEILFTLVASWLFFKETIKRKELVGIGLVAAGILMLGR